MKLDPSTLQSPAPRSARADAMTIALITLLASIGGIAACSSMPERNLALERAHARFGAAQSNPQVNGMAVDELQAAAQALRSADQSLATGGTLAETDHLAYLANQRVALAEESAASRNAEQQVKTAAAERERMRLSMRTQEADTARAQLAQSQQANAAQSGALARADAKADRSDAALAQREARMHELETQLDALHAKKTERGMVITLSDTLFDTGRFALSPEGRRNMSKLAEFFQRYPTRRATVEGYTDSVGTIGANQLLSERRAQAVVRALTDLGVDASRLTVRAYGEEQPIASNDTVAGRQQNRRVEILFTAQDEDVSMN
ncbi:OmpA family protein [Paucibacter sp. APW11]|uniref:OmpA family protein n=1 Tax=Roseateles aquae TaxID=3077235 RepID=A0ABU3P7N3_9BURK|nr:OmpA family protein [Paucibacter sp. APW11]MDT8997751.1 OmpA family protein [Paucibacter sp. APW11]